ncbi:MAG: class I SAM-dependent methyltransferase [Spirochaetota bacterium]|nr:class I SAM-dependent methyltransferase [Spirochaetota bacterium]
MINEKELYEIQEAKLKNYISFPILRKLFKKYDLHREDLALNLLEKGENFLDIGCGTGSLLFKAKSKYNHIYGIDIVDSKINKAKKEAEARKINNSYFFVSNINEKIDFQDNMFDAVTCIAVIEHIFDPYSIVNEIYRIIKNGGIFIADVPNIAYIKQRFCLLLGRLPVTGSPYNWKETGWDSGHLHYFTEKTFCNLLEDCGFKILEVTGCGLFGKIRGLYPSLLTGDICVKAMKK